MTTPDPNLPDPNTAPDEPIEHTLARLEATGRLLHDDTPYICPAGCEMVPGKFHSTEGHFARAVEWNHQVDCALYLPKTP